MSDVSELRGLAADLGKASAGAIKVADAVLKKGALGIKNAMIGEATSGVAGGHARHFPRSITFDRSFGGLSSIGYEIGPDKDRTQGALGNLLYFGSVNNGPVLDIESGMNSEAPKIEKYLGEDVEDLLNG